MRQATTQITVATRGKGLHEITRDVVMWAGDTGIATGLLTIYCRHTSCSLLIQENADPDVRTDLEAWFERAAPEGADYVHDLEGPDDMPAHIRTAITASTLGIPVTGGKPVLGTWQGIYLFEHRARPHRRSMVLHIIGE